MYFVKPLRLAAGACSGPCVDPGNQTLSLDFEPNFEPNCEPNFEPTVTVTLILTLGSCRITNNCGRHGLQLRSRRLPLPWCADLLSAAPHSVLPPPPQLPQHS